MGESRHLNSRHFLHLSKYEQGRLCKLLNSYNSVLQKSSSTLMFKHLLYNMSKNKIPSPIFHILYIYFFTFTMNNLWKNIFASHRSRVAFRKVECKTGWFCSSCGRNFGRACNAALHLAQSAKCNVSKVCSPSVKV